MPADTSKFVAGHYIVSYDGADIGTTEVGFDMALQYHKEDIRIDDFGDSIVDGIYRGYNIRISSQLVQWAADGRELLQWLFDKEDAGSIGKIQFVGRTLQSFAKPMVFTPVPDINVNNKIYTFPLVVPDGAHGGWNLNTKNRRVKLSLLALVNITSGIVMTET